ncbi:hypothetical protein [Wolbachia endosymbiont of Atemnus politus]|uniref:hypothetical protein n=1 Tax=Wolbachia endosymbiont of Atemnus politus TaxID=2682840 RepID=UPI00397D874B
MYNDKFRLGYGYSHTSKKETKQYLDLVEYYLIQRRSLKRAFVLIDSKLGLKEIDKDFIY